ncbi:glycosyltransferase [Acinetobacter pseudolwoffii]|uniref:glycosyltransferase n=1 Tax=Acinetobacter pseudolwoffii TaxID=2053287 RepID=UPI0039891C77
MKVFFLSGLLIDEDKVTLKSVGGIQNAANVLQKKYIEGLSASDKVKSIHVINLSYIGSYPKLYREINFKPTKKYFNEGKVKYYDIPFFNLLFFKNISRFVKSFYKSFNLLKDNKSDDNIFFIYAMHLPFLLSVIFLKFFFPTVKFYVIVPDLPEFMSSRTGILKILFNFISKFSYFIVNRLDGVIPITNDMASLFNTKLNKVVIEGISSSSDFNDIHLNETQRYFLYTGSLDNRYGLKLMLDSFIKAELNDIDLIICGDGKDRQVVNHYANEYKNIKYLGMVNRKKALELQKNATLLINPRQNLGEYVKYSFPSKVLEYMSSGTPVLMHKLPGIPDEYYNFAYVIEDSNDSFINMLKMIANTDSDSLKAKGAAAHDFVQKHKNPKAQIEKILTSIG